MYHVVAARNLDRYGFYNLRFAGTADSRPEVGLPPRYYTHWPSFPVVVLGALFRLGMSLEQARALPLIASSSALLGTFLLTRRMLGDWRVGIIALLAFGAEAPLRLLSDLTTYMPYDFAAKVWILLLLTLGSFAAGRRQTVWFAAAGLGAFAAMALSGFEMLPAIAFYSVLFPLLFASGQLRQRVPVAARAAMFIGAGAVAGFLLRLAHNAWMLDGIAPVIEDFVNVFFFRSVSDYGGIYYGRTYIQELGYRLLNYYPVHLLVIVAGLVTLVIGALTGRQYLDRAALRWLGVIFLGEVLWFLVFRPHTHQHPHTSYHLALSMALGTALAAVAVWRALGRATLLRPVAGTAGVALLAASVAGVGVHGYGNLHVRELQPGRQEEVAALTALLAADAVVIVDLRNNSYVEEPSVQFFLGRPALRPFDEVSRLRPVGRPWFFLTHREPEDLALSEQLRKYRLMATTDSFALFDLSASLAQ